MADFNELWERASKFGVGGLKFRTQEGYGQGLVFHCVLLSAKTGEPLVGGSYGSPLSAFEDAIEALEQGDGHG